MSDLFNTDTHCQCCGQPLPEASVAPGFAEFWQRVPHKIAKAQAEKNWKKLSKAQRALAAERVSEFYSRWQKAHPTASPLHPATYLSHRRWEDLEPETHATSQHDPERAAMIEKMLNSSSPAVREAARKMQEQSA